MSLGAIWRVLMGSERNHKRGRFMKLSAFPLPCDEGCQVKPSMPSEFEFQMNNTEFLCKYVPDTTWDGAHLY